MFQPASRPTPAQPAQQPASNRTGLGSAAGVQAHCMGCLGGRAAHQVGSDRPAPAPPGLSSSSHTRRSTPVGRPRLSPPLLPPLAQAALPGSQATAPLSPVLTVPLNPDLSVPLNTNTRLNSGHTTLLSPLHSSSSTPPSQGHTCPRICQRGKEGLPPPRPSTLAHPWPTGLLLLPTGL